MYIATNIVLHVHSNKYFVIHVHSNKYFVIHVHKKYCYTCALQQMLNMCIATNIVIHVHSNNVLSPQLVSCIMHRLRGSLYIELLYIFIAHNGLPLATKEGM